MGKLFVPTLVLALTIVAGSLFVSHSMSFNDHDVIVTVTDKERIVETRDNKTTSKYLIMGKDENDNPVVYENTDSILRMKFNSSDYQANIEVGDTYKFTVIGYRIPFMSIYENIISYEEVD